MKCRSWWWCSKNTFLLSSKRLVFSITSRLTHKAKGSKHGLVNLSKDMESCSEYADIQVMWEMLHSSACPSNTKYNINRNHNKRTFQWKFCFRPA
ncbi:hypothetical protein AQUCO_03000232v1 [Aquilegia coerulea]|uniref:Uncharacterized protein n=1 Tax=Aquilegia coerulea TaxID=218851 RepID=A0A2G5D1W4_AQUCA|nr:hypothetical protein AQUCO_03000232v1 [Aquilegia coerulea]